MAGRRDKSLDIIKTLSFFWFHNRAKDVEHAYEIELNRFVFLTDFFFSNNNYTPKTIP